MVGNKKNTSSSSIIMTKTFGRAALAASLVIGAAPFATAQDLGDARPSGGFELEYLVQDGSNNTYLDGQIDMMHRGMSAGAVQLGFDLGVDATFDLTRGGEMYALYGAIVVDPGFGNFAVGAPRSIGGMLIDRPAFAGNKALSNLADVVVPPVADSMSKLTKEQSFGLRYDNEAGALRYGASIQKVNEIHGLFVQAAAEYSFGQGQIEGLIENNTKEGGLSMLLGVNGTAGQFDYAVYAGDQRTILDGTGLQASIGYAVSDSLRVGGDLARVDIGNSMTDLWGLSGQYDFAGGAYAQLGVSDGEDTQALWDASIGFEF